MTKPAYILVLDAHPIEDGRIQKHLRFLQENGYRVFHIHFIPYAQSPDVADGEYSLFGEGSWHLNLRWKTKIPGVRLLNYLSLFSPILLRKVTRVIQSFLIPVTDLGIIHVHDPILLPLAVKIQKKWLTQAKIVYDRHEIYEDMRKTMGMGGYRLFEIFPKNNISGVVVVSNFFSHNVARMFPRSKVTTVQNYPLKSSINTTKIQEKIQSISKTTSIRCIYIGSLRNDLDRDLDLLFSTAHHILTLYPTLKFYIGGACDDKHTLKKMSELQQLFQNRFVYLGVVPASKVISLTQEAHIGFLFLKNQGRDDIRAPNKVFEYLACGVIPVIRGAIDHSNIISSCAIMFTNQDESNDINRTLTELLEDPERMKILMEKTCEVGNMFFWEKESEKYSLLYEEVFS